MQHPRPINSGSRVKDAYARLKADVLSSVLPPGFQAPEPEIAARMGMSRTPVREALIRLEAEGLVELIPRRGARVLPVRVDDMREIYDLLTILEPHAAAALASRKPDDATLAPLLAATDAMEAALAENDLQAWATADDRFHRRLLSLHDNARLRDIVTTLFDQAHRARMVTLRLRKPPVQSTKDHRDILNSLRAGDAETVRHVFTDHRARAANELLRVLETLGLPHL